MFCKNELRAHELGRRGRYEDENYTVYVSPYLILTEKSVAVIRHYD